MEVSLIYDELVRIFDPRLGGAGTAYASPEEISPKPTSTRSFSPPPRAIHDDIEDDWLDVVDTRDVCIDGYVLLTKKSPTEFNAEKVESIDLMPPMSPSLMPPTSPSPPADNDGQWECPQCTFCNTLPLYAGAGPAGEPSEVTCAVCDATFPFSLDPIPPPMTAALSANVQRAPCAMIPSPPPPPPARPYSARGKGGGGGGAAGSLVGAAPRYR